MIPMHPPPNKQNRRLGAAGPIEKSADGVGAEFSFATLAQTTHDPNCGRCGGTAGPEGNWCDRCIRICRDHTEWLDRPGVA